MSRELKRHRDSCDIKMQKSSSFYSRGSAHGQRRSSCARKNQFSNPTVRGLNDRHLGHHGSFREERTIVYEPGMGLNDLPFTASHSNSGSDNDLSGSEFEFQRPSQSSTPRGRPISASRSHNSPVVEHMSQDLRALIQQHQAFQLDVQEKLALICENQTNLENRLSELEKVCKAGDASSQASGVEKRKRTVKRSLSVC